MRADPSKRYQIEHLNWWIEYWECEFYRVHESKSLGEVRTRLVIDGNVLIADWRIKEE